MSFYLALKEVWRLRGRFLLISLVIALITVLVLFVAGLAEGLGAGNIEYLSKLNADLIVYQENSSLSISSSQLDRSKVADIKRVDGVQAVGPIAFSSASIVFEDGRKPLDISLVGVEPGLIGAPPIADGRAFISRRANEAVLDRNAALRANLKVGDTVTIKAVQGTQEEFYPLQIVGLSDGQQYFLRPSVFVPDITWDKIRPKASTASSSELIYNIVAVKLNDPAEAASIAQRIAAQVNRVQVADRQTAYRATPGYAEQQATLDTQRIFTLIIGVLVIGGFFQIQTLQKVPQIGVLKAIGTPNRTVAIASIVQVTVVTIIGVLLGALGTLALAANFPVTVPIVFRANTVAIALISLLLIGPIGGLVSVRYSLRIEPLRALGLGR
jgi:putative ABC transport system permease protein